MLQIFGWIGILVGCFQFFFNPIINHFSHLQEATAAAALAKYRKAQAEVDDAEERAQRAERALVGRARGKTAR